jgi:hypothetical protein
MLESYMKLSIVSIALILGLAAQSHAGIITYTDYSAWQAALGGSSQVTEDFNGSASNFSANSTGNSIGTYTTLDLIGGVGDPGPTGLTDDGFLEGEVDSSSFSTSDGLSLQFNASNIFGFGILGLQNDSNSSPGGLDLEEVGIEFGGESFLVSDILGLTNSSDGNSVSSTENSQPIPFIGFLSDTTASSFSFVHGDSVALGGVSGGNEAFYIDSLVLARADVPEPSAIALLALGLTWLGLMRRKNA